MRGAPKRHETASARHFRADPGDGTPCAACATFESDEAWRALPLVLVMRPEDVLKFVTRWRAGVIEIRRCGRCGRSVARAVPLTGSPHAAP
jgi:hypothetical protein